VGRHCKKDQNVKGQHHLQEDRCSMDPFPLGSRRKLVGCYADKIAGPKQIRSKAVHVRKPGVRNCCKLYAFVAVVYSQQIWNETASVVWKASQNHEVQR